MTHAPTPDPTLAELRQRLGVKGNEADAQLDWDLRVATAWVEDRVYESPDGQPGERHPEVVEAILLLASKLYARRNSPEGVAGWNDLGVVRIIAEDPDLASLLERHVDYSRVGLA